MCAVCSRSHERLVPRRGGRVPHGLGALDSDKRSDWSLSTIGIETVVCVLLGTAIGYGLDRWLDTSPWLLLVGLLIGIAAAFKTLVALLKTDSGGDESRPRRGG